MRGNFGRTLSLFMTLSLVGLLFFSIIDTMVVWTFLELVSWVIQLEESLMDELSIVLLTFNTMFFLHLILGLLLTGMGLLYYSLKEIQEANHLKEKIRDIGRQRRIQGLERED
jgi:hypothetical protein